jgi:hypothetical protein
MRVSGSLHPINADTIAMTTSGQAVYIDDATHWVLRDAPE